MTHIDLQQIFAEFDELPPKLGYFHVIDAALEVVQTTDQMIAKLADISLAGEAAAAGKTRYGELLGAIGQLWSSPQLKGLPQHPSSLGQLLVLGGAGALGGYGIGKAIDYVAPNDAVKASRAGAILGGLVGMTPGLASAYLNSHVGRPVWTTSFWDKNQKVSAFGSPSDYDAMLHSINVQDFQNAMWNDPHIVHSTPLPLRAAASGLVMGAANMPDKYRNSTFVSPMDVARMAVGMGSGWASGWLVGKTLGAMFGTGKKTQELLRTSGMAAGALKTVIPMAFGGEPYDF